MNKFQNVETSTLVKLLAEHTQELTKMLTRAISSKKYEKHKKFIEELQAEISGRQNSKGNTTVTRREVAFEEQDASNTDEKTT
jgi:hypothetical protein